MNYIATILFTIIATPILYSMEIDTKLDMPKKMPNLEIKSADIDQRLKQLEEGQAICNDKTTMLEKEVVQLKQNSATISGILLTATVTSITTVATYVILYKPL